MKLGLNIKLVNPKITKRLITSGFGWRIHPITGKREFHNGVDIALAKGEPLYAVADSILESGFHPRGGNQIVQKFQIGNQWVRIGYAHCDWVVNKAQALRGEIIARVGNTGTSTGAHLHLTVAIWTPSGWQFLDPETVFNWDDPIV